MASKPVEKRRTFFMVDVLDRSPELDAAIELATDIVWTISTRDLEVKYNRNDGSISLDRDKLIRLPVEAEEEIPSPEMITLDPKIIEICGKITSAMPKFQEFLFFVAIVIIHKSTEIKRWYVCKRAENDKKIQEKPKAKALDYDSFKVLAGAITFDFDTFKLSLDYSDSPEVVMLDAMESENDCSTDQEDCSQLDKTALSTASACSIM